MEQNRTKNQSNPIELQSFDWVRQSNKIEHLFCCEFDFRTNGANIIEQDRTKSNVRDAECYYGISASNAMVLYNFHKTKTVRCHEKFRKETALCSG